MRIKPFMKLLSVYLMFAIFILTMPVQGWAMFIPAGEMTPSRQADLDTIQKTLESSLIRQRLMDFGLTSEEAMARVNNLSNEQIHQFAAKLDALQAGGDGVDALIFLLLVAIVVIVVLEATGHHVILR